jgi:hypothetical protein
VSGTVFFKASEEATTVAFVANTLPQWLDTQKQCIRVTIEANLYHTQNVTARFSFSPQAITGPAEENRFAGSLRLCKRLCVHEAKHQYLIGAAVLNNGGYQTAGFCECDFHS